MKATLTVNKAELLGKLEAAVTEIEVNGRYAKEIREMQEALTMVKERENSPDFAERMAEYFATIADGIRAGTITVKASGKLYGNVPTKPVKNRVNRYERLGKEQLENQIESHKHWHRSELKPYRTAVELLNMAQGETIEIDSADYQQLLGGIRY